MSTSTLSFELPEGVSEVDDHEPTDGWTESHSDNPDEPTIVIRVSDESEKVSGIEIIGTGISPSQVDEIRDSLEYTP